MEVQELQSKVLDYLSKNVDKEYCPRVFVKKHYDVYEIEIYIVCEIRADKEDVYVEIPVFELYDPESDDLDSVLDYIASEIRTHEIEDNRRYDETGAAY